MKMQISDLKFLDRIVSVILVILLLLLFLGIYVNVIFQKKNVNNLFIDIDITKIIKENSIISNILNTKKVPDEVFDYIDKNKIKDIIEDYIDKLYSNDFNIIDDRLQLLVRDSVNIYEKKNSIDVYEYIENDILGFFNNAKNKINNKQFVSSFNSFINFFNSKYVYIIISILLIFIIFEIYIKNWKTFLLLGIVNIISSFLIFAFNKKILIFILRKINLSYYISNKLVNYFAEKTDFLYLSLFFIGFIFVIIYLLFFINRLIVKSRILYYEKYYGR